ncbi:unnamed protein product [Prunus armeniaca]
MQPALWHRQHQLENTIFTQSLPPQDRSVKLPESGGAFVDGDMSLEACKEKCLENCSCTAYCYMEISNGRRGCVMWFGELMDMRLYADGGQDLYVLGGG